MTAAAYGKCDVVMDVLDSGADVNAQKHVSHYHHRLESLHAFRLLGNARAQPELYPHKFLRSKIVTRTLTLLKRY